MSAQKSDSGVSFFCIDTVFDGVCSSDRQRDIFSSDYGHNTNSDSTKEGKKTLVVRDNK